MKRIFFVLNFVIVLMTSLSITCFAYSDSSYIKFDISENFDDNELIVVLHNDESLLCNEYSVTYQMKIKEKLML